MGAVCVALAAYILRIEKRHKDERDEDRKSQKEERDEWRKTINSQFEDANKNAGILQGLKTLLENRNK